MMCANTVRPLPPCRLGKSCRIQAWNDCFLEILDFRRYGTEDVPAHWGVLLLKRGLVMNQNINYIGMVNLLRRLRNAGLVSHKEARRIAARLRAETGADVIFSP